MNRTGETKLLSVGSLAYQVGGGGQGNLAYWGGGEEAYRKWAGGDRGRWVPLLGYVNTWNRHTEVFNFNTVW